MTPVARLGAVLTCLAAGGVGAAYLNQSVAAPPPSPRPLEASSAPSCPLPVGQQVKGVKAFRQMIPVFRHPRCLNCHGGVDPLSERHRGADQLDSKIDRMTDREAFEEQCQTCHDQMPGLIQGWTIPGPPVFFVDENGAQKSQEQLCLQMKRFSRTGEDFVEHLDNDHFGVQFIAAGFVGDRALGEGMKDYDLVPEPPPGTQADLVSKAQRWVDLLGEGYVSSPECGCVFPTIKLEIQHRYTEDTGDAASAVGFADFAGEVKFQVTLKPVDRKGAIWYTADTSLVRPLTATHAQPGCRGQASVTEKWMIVTVLEGDADAMDLHLGIDASPGRGSGTCRGQPIDFDPMPVYAIEQIRVPLQGPGTARTTGQGEGYGGGVSREWMVVKLLDAESGRPE